MAKKKTPRKPKAPEVVPGQVVRFTWSDAPTEVDEVVLAADKKGNILVRGHDGEAPYDPDPASLGTWRVY